MVPTDNAAAFRDLPSVDELLRSSAGTVVTSEAGGRFGAELARRVIAELRAELIGNGTSRSTRDAVFEAAQSKLTETWVAERSSRLRRVVNATGVLIHTNLGRSPLSTEARQAITDEAAGYCTLEYSQAVGMRGQRGGRVEEMLAELTGAESVLVVNNCAAAAYFVLTVFAADGEVIVSRGELVEIGGDFRVPDVLARSGAILREVGTTNRTKLADYENAITERTRVLLRVHPSNYRIVGFSAMPNLAELAGLARGRGLLLYEDIGSGALFKLDEYGIDEPVVRDSIEAGADLVTFSGDKLLGGPQAGMIAGRKELIDRLRNNPLYRALRVDKLVLASLEATLESHRRGTAVVDIPVLRMLSLSSRDIADRVERFIDLAKAGVGDGELSFSTIEGESSVGGGAAPGSTLPTTLIKLSHPKISANALADRLRLNDPPVIARIAEGHVVIDLRTVAEDEERELLAALSAI